MRLRDPVADHKRRDAMAVAAAAYLHPKVNAIDAKLSPAIAESSLERRSIEVTFIVPGADRTRDEPE